jgi:hypothetical protein
VHFILVGSWIIATAFLFGQDAGSKTFQLKYIDAEMVRRIYSGQAFLLQVDRDSNLLTARGSTAFLNDVEASVKRFDVPPAIPRNVQITVYVLGLTAKSPGGSKLPPDIESANPDFKLYSLIDTETLRVRSGQPGDARNLEPASDKLAGIARVRFRSVAILEAQGKNALGFEGLQIDLNIPGARATAKPGSDSAINTDLDIPEKQAVVVGKAGQDKPLIVLVRGEIPG